MALNLGFYPKQKFYVIKETLPGHFIRTSERDKAKEEEIFKEMLDSGLNYNEVGNFFYNESGALVTEGNITIEDMVKYPRFKELIDAGYEFQYGKPTPICKEFGWEHAIYCKNYQEIISHYIEALGIGKVIEDEKEENKTTVEIPVIRSNNETALERVEVKSSEVSERLKELREKVNIGIDMESDALNFPSSQSSSEHTR